MTGDPQNAPWTAEDLQHLAGTRELQIAVPRAGRSPGRWTPIWVVVAEDAVYVRTWQRRSTGWYGRAVESARAWIRVAGEPVEVIVEAIGDADADVIAAAYRAKYGANGAQSMVTAEAAASTLRLSRAS